MSWQWFAFCKEPNKWTTNMLIFFRIGCTRLDVCGNTSSDFLEFNKIGVVTNIFSVVGYQTWFGRKWDYYNTLCTILLHFWKNSRYDWNREWIKLSMRPVKTDASMYIVPGSGLNALYLPTLCISIGSK